MTIQIERLRQEIKMENRKFALQLVIAIAKRERCATLEARVAELEARQ